MHLAALLVLEEGSEQLGVVGSSQTSDGVPALDSREANVAALAGGAVAVGTAQVLVARGDVVERVGVLVQDGIEEAEGTLLAGDDALVDDAVDETGKDGGRLGRAAAGALAAVDDDDTVEAVGGDVGVATAGAVVDAAVVGDDTVGGVVRLVAGVVLGKVTTWHEVS